MGIDAEIHVDFSALEGKVSPASFRRGTLAFTNQALLDMNRYVPRLDGDLRASGSATEDSIKWSTVYARAQFYGSNGIATFKKYTEPGTGKRWDKRVTNKEVEEWGRIGLKAMGIDK